MKTLRFVTVALAFAFTVPAVACGGTASEEQCKKAADNLVDITVAQQLKAYADAPEDQKKAAEKAAREAAGKTKDSFMKSCTKAPSDAVKCIADAKDMAAFTECQKKYSK